MVIQTFIMYLAIDLRELFDATFEGRHSKFVFTVSYYFANLIHLIITQEEQVIS